MAGFFDMLQNGDVGGLLGTVGQGLADRRGLLYGIAANGFAGANEGRQSDQNALLLKQKQQERELKRQALLAYAQANGIDPGLAQDEDTLRMQIQAKQHEEMLKHQAAQDATANSHWGADYKLRQEQANRPTEDIREYEYGQRNPGFLDAMAKLKAAKSGGGVGLQPIYGEDADKNPVVMQMTPNGLRRAANPEGVTPFNPYTKAAAEAEGKATGTAQGKLAAAAPQLIVNGEKFDRNIEEMVKDPALKYVTGLYSMGPIVPNTPQARADERIKEVKGETFLQAYNDLRGAGAITAIEGTKGEEAKARLGRAQSTEDFIAAARELQSIVRASTARLRRVGGRGGGPVAGQAAPSEDQGAFGGGSIDAPRLKSKYGLE